MLIRSLGTNYLVKISVLLLLGWCKQFWFYYHNKWLLLYIEFDFLGVRKQECQLKTKILNIFCILRCWKFQCQIHIESVEDICLFWWSSCVTLIGMAAWENFVHFEQKIEHLNSIGYLLPFIYSHQKWNDEIELLYNNRTICVTSFMKDPLPYILAYKPTRI